MLNTRLTLAALIALSVVVAGRAPARADSPLAPAAAVVGVPGDVRSPDVNGDRRPDIVAVLFGTDQISVRLNTGHGTFGPARHYDAGFKASIQEPGDFNRDGKLDLAVSDTAGSAVAVFLGVGDGTFEAARMTTLADPADGRFKGVGAFGLVVRDVDHDGKQDIVAATTGSDHLEVLRGHGDGTFGAPRAIRVPSPLSVFPFALAAGDFDADRNFDLVSGGFGSVSTYAGTRDGAFTPTATYDLPGFVVAWIDVLDMNGDRIDDIVLTGTGTLNVDVLLGDGRGGFSHGENFYSGGIGPQGLSTGDLNGDHHPDIAVANTATAAGQGNVTVFLNSGRGHFRQATSYPAGVSPFTTSIADFNGDGKPDLLSAVALPCRVHVAEGNGDGTFEAPVAYDM